ncbi:MAG: hypothetical protein EHM83_05050 [Burkholderiales bacterium]|nr:MAG: hypothetical protein EHM83_05050 [Burkholderiales bacterium]
MSQRSDLGTQAAAVQAVERVLRAERDAEAELARARDRAQAQLEAAREDALAIVNRAAERIARWQRGHGEALDRRLAALRDEAAASSQAQSVPDEPAIGAAVARVAARLTGAADADEDDVAQ